jgi:hypothetical protein
MPIFYKRSLADPTKYRALKIALVAVVMFLLLLLVMTH